MGFWDGLGAAGVTAGANYLIGDKMAKIQADTLEYNKKKDKQDQDNLIAANKAKDARTQAAYGQIYGGLMEANQQDNDNDGRLDVVQNDSFYNTNVSSAFDQNTTEAIQKRRDTADTSVKNVQDSRKSEADYLSENGQYKDYAAYQAANPNREGFTPQTETEFTTAQNTANTAAYEQYQADNPNVAAFTPQTVDEYNTSLDAQYDAYSATVSENGATPQEIDAWKAGQTSYDEYLQNTPAVDGFTQLDQAGWLSAGNGDSSTYSDYAEAHPADAGFTQLTSDAFGTSDYASTYGTYSAGIDGQVTAAEAARDEVYANPYEFSSQVKTPTGNIFADYKSETF